MLGFEAVSSTIRFYGIHFSRLAPIVDPSSSESASILVDSRDKGTLSLSLNLWPDAKT